MDARAKMEARRKKILQNAEARMSKIVGKPYNCTDLADNLSCETHPVVNGSVNGSSTSHFVDPEIYERIEHTALNSMEVTEDPHHTISAPGFLNCCFFVSLGIIIRLSFFIGTELLYDNIFIPFLALGVPWAYIFSKDSHLSSILSSALLLSGLQRPLLQTTYRIITFFRLLTQFFSLYLFSFILVHCVIHDTTLLNS